MEDIDNKSRAFAGFAGADADDVGKSGHEHFAVARAGRSAATHDRVQHKLQFRIGHNNLDFDLGDEIT